MFSRILNFLFVIVFLREKIFYARKITVILAFYNLFRFLYENPFRTDQSKRQISWEKNSGFVDSGFVKTCDELVIGLIP